MAAVIGAQLFVDFTKEECTRRFNSIQRDLEDGWLVSYRCTIVQNKHIIFQSGNINKCMDIVKKVFSQTKIDFNNSYYKETHSAYEREDIKTNKYVIGDSKPYNWGSFQLLTDDHIKEYDGISRKLEVDIVGKVHDEI